MIYFSRHLACFALSFLLFNLHMLRGKFQRSGIPIHTQAANNPHSLVAEVAVMSPSLPRMHIRDVQLDERNVDAQERIPNRHAGVGVTTGVDDDNVNVPASGLDPVDDAALVVGLEVLKVNGELLGLLLGAAQDIVECGRSICFGLSRAQEVQVGSVDQKDAARHD